MTLEPNKIVWTCSPSIEASQYGCGFIEPYQVKLVECPGALWQGSRFDERTGEIDDDTNATCYIHSPYEVFETHKEACDFYERWVLNDAIDALGELERFRDYRKEQGV